MELPIVSKRDFDIKHSNLVISLFKIYLENLWKQNREKVEKQHFESAIINNCCPEENIDRYIYMKIGHIFV